MNFNLEDLPVFISKIQTLKYSLKDVLFNKFFLIKHALLKIFNISTVCTPCPMLFKNKINVFIFAAGTGKF